MAVKKTGTMIYCSMCGTESLSSDFYESTNPHDGYECDSKGNVKRMGYVKICKKHIAQVYLDYLKKGTMQSAVYFTCALTDTPAIS